MNCYDLSRAVVKIAAEGDEDPSREEVNISVEGWLRVN
jgi:hypothetical protein